MPYAILNQAIFAAAYAGSFAAMNESGLGSFTASPSASSYLPNLGVAIAFAESYDTQRGAAASSTFEANQVQSLAYAAFAQRNPSGFPSSSLTPAFWNPLATEIGAAVTEALAVLAAQTSNPPAAPGGNASQKGANAAATAAAATSTYDITADLAGGYIPKTTGSLLAIFEMAVLTSAVDTAVTFQGRLAAAASGVPTLPTESGHVTANANATIARVYPCVAGVAVNPGIQAAAAAGTCQAAIGSVGWQIVELQQS